MDENQINQVLGEIFAVDTAMGSSTIDPSRLVERALSVMQILDQNSFFRRTVHVDRQIYVLRVFQRLAFYDVDAGSVAEISDWCISRWLRVLSRNPRNVDILQGVGQWWLNKAQPTLARVHVIDGGSSSSDGGTRRLSTTGSEEEPQSQEWEAEARARLYSSDYVEARGILQPAAEYLRQAVEEAERSNSITGQLLILAAEAYMSLGNVSFSQVNMQYFRQAILYLRAARNMAGFSLPGHLERYLEDYGVYVD